MEPNNNPYTWATNISYNNPYKNFFVKDPEPTMPEIVPYKRPNTFNNNYFASPPMPTTPEEPYKKTYNSTNNFKIPTVQELRRTLRKKSKYNEPLPVRPVVAPPSVPEPVPEPVPVPVQEPVPVPEPVITQTLPVVSKPVLSSHSDPKIMFQIHRETNKFYNRKDELAKILMNDLNITDLSKYDDIYAYLDSTIGEFIRTTPKYDTKRREKMLADYTRIIKQIKDGDVSKEYYPFMGLVTDFIFKHNLEYFFVSAWVKDCMTAYSNGDPISCVKGIVERFATILRDVSRSLSGGVFDELNEMFTASNENVEWNALSKMQKTIYRQILNEAFKDWLNKVKEGRLQFPSSNSRYRAVTDHLKYKFQKKKKFPLPESAWEALKPDIIGNSPEEFNGLYGFEGGRRKNRKTRRGKAKKSKQTMRRRKH
jgi:hypothetical protein